ncbi:MAG TPA: class I SAM-dependent methyltransferase [Methylococcaceae bacterium]|nr:class I SAM-dependent methyltransferase [Methylococcaceae bacterium]
MSLPNHCRLCATAAGQLSVVTPHVYGDRSGRAFYRCSACDAIFLYPGLSREEEHKFYAAEFESFMSGRSGDAGGWSQPEKHIAANHSTVARRMRYLRPALPAGGRVLEVGCSSGFMLFPLREVGYECAGIEPSGIFRDYLGARGIPCHDSLDALRDTGEADEGFDAILHFFVLEHVADPRSFLQAQLEMLRPGGVLIFEVPNAADALVTVYDIPEFERFYWSVAHHWYFTEHSLGHLLDGLDCAWELQRDQRYDLSNHMVWARDGRPGGMGRFTAKIGTEIEEAYKQALIRSGHCDTLVGILRK